MQRQWFKLRAKFISDMDSFFRVVDTTVSNTVSSQIAFSLSRSLALEATLACYDLIKQQRSLNLTTMVVIVAVALVLGILLGLLILNPRHRKSGHTGKVQSNLNDNKVYGKAEVALHNKRTDCWIIIKNKVYDVTSYVEEHPGGDAILTHAGDDSTEGFFGPQHATRVFDMIDDFCIGDLRD
ncbi:hypothetical protein L6164_005211 [Bauhinia variegata]|uniref:Uncharacterized protein n=1 Tax=Bauhinia variegata TaxID=167791 RepID=A0ACB9PQL5_BAUVA|nr:hypothetical protein L6164_005211 [Bauhinia variegata]